MKTGRLLIGISIFLALVTLSMLHWMHKDVSLLFRFVAVWVQATAAGIFLWLWFLVFVKK